MPWLQPPWPPSLLWAGPRPSGSRLGLVVVLLAGLLAAATGTNAGSGCRSQYCYNMYVASEDYHDGVRVDNFNYRRDGPGPLHDTVCLILRTFSRCLQATAPHCRADLMFHGMDKTTEQKLQRQHCPQEGAVWTLPPPESARPTPPTDHCVYRGGAGRRHCGLFGDPHLRTFNNDFQTCRVQGTWPLVDTDHLTVQVTNQPVAVWSDRVDDIIATATSKVTVLIKAESACGPRDFLTYQAAVGTPLPGALDDGRQALGNGPAATVTVTTVEPDHVRVYVKYVDTTVVVRQLPSGFLSVAILMPEELVKASLLQNPDRLDLCQRGCPRAERIDQAAVLRRRRQPRSRRHAPAPGEDVSVNQHVTRDRDTTAPHSDRTVNRDVTRDDFQRRRREVAGGMDLAAAKKTCWAARLVDFYYDSCVFDLVTTGDAHFSLAARRALDDLYDLYPDGVKLHANRTTLEERRPAANAAAPCCTAVLLWILVAACSPFL